MQFILYVSFSLALMWSALDHTHMYFALWVLKYLFSNCYYLNIGIVLHAYDRVYVNFPNIV